MKKLVLTGNNPLKWGHQQGESFKNEIHELNEIRQRLLRKYLSSWDPAKISSLCLSHLSTLEKRYPHLYSEVLGVHEASGLSLEELMVVNAYTDLRDFSFGEAARIEDGCSIIAVKSEKANWVAQTWDMHASATPYTVFLEYPEVPELNLQSQKVLSVTGCLGLAGINDNNVSVMINNMHCSEFDESGLIWTGLVRQLLNQKSAIAAAEYLKNNMPSSGHNYTICDADNAFNIETTGKRWNQTSLLTTGSDGFSLHTNHYIGELSENEIMERQSPTTHKRLDALNEYFSDQKWKEANGSELQKEFFEGGSACNTICIPPKGEDPDAGATCGGLIIDHNAKTAVGFQGLLSDNIKVEVKLK